MGGRGASSGVSYNGKKYGTEFRTVLQSGNIKYVKSNTGAARAPVETMTKGRVYATVNEKNQVKSISYYDKHNKRYKQIDVSGQPHLVNGKLTLPHVHIGYLHDEGGTRAPTKKEQKFIERVLKTWYYHNSK